VGEFVAVEPGEEDRRGCEEYRQDPGHQEDGGDAEGGPGGSGDGHGDRHQAKGDEEV
jgi:hypothetical protein